MTAESLPLVAIDLGSNGIRAMAARRVDSDLLHILGVEQSQKYQCVQNGVVTQSGNAGYMINQVLRLLSNRIGVEELPTAFLCVGGRGVQIESVSAKRDQVRPREVSAKMLEDMEDECKKKLEIHNPHIAVLGLIPSYYVLDGKDQDQAPQPTQRAALVEVNYIAFVAKKEQAQQFIKGFDQAGKSIEETFVRPEALLSAFACEDGYDVLQQGCALIDMGAQTTTLTIFKGSQYLYHKVIPQGGYHLTRIIEQQGVSFNTAEMIKCKYGFASASQVEKNYKMRIPLSDGSEQVLTSEELAYMLSLKLEEIINPLMEVINQYADRIQTVYITGGASMLGGMDSYLQQKTPIKVMYGAHDELLDATTEEKYYEPTYSSLVGTLIMGADYREAHKGEIVKTPGVWDKIKEGTIDIFAGQAQ